MLLLESQICNTNVIKVRLLFKTICENNAKCIQMVRSNNAEHKTDSTNTTF